MVSGAGPGPEADLALAKARYRSGDSRQIAEAYASDAKYAFVFWLSFAFVASNVVANFVPLFWVVAIPLGMLLAWQGFKLIRTIERRRQMMNNVAARTRNNEDSTER